ncbi:unnamed protein product [Klebsiella pneumoniae subsp. rhinoscleromatis SB3432]|nr:unnamed protein product [Klebsiella pneumoniae subsp. rhinoscleromatis SB3432]
MSQPAIDLTSELLRGMRLSGVNYRRIETARPFGVGFSAVAGKAQFHFISRGPVLLRMASGEQFTLESGDALFIPNGDGHALLSDPQATVVNVAQLPSETVCSTVSCINAGDQPDCPERAVIFSGCMDFELGGKSDLRHASAPGGQLESGRSGAGGGSFTLAVRGTFSRRHRHHPRPLSHRAAYAAGGAVHHP